MIALLYNTVSIIKIENSVCSVRVVMCYRLIRSNVCKGSRAIVLLMVLLNVMSVMKTTFSIKI